MHASYLTMFIQVHVTSLILSYYDTDFKIYDIYIENNMYTVHSCCACMMTSSNRNIFRVTGPLWGEPTVTPLTRASDAGLWCFLWSAPEQIVEQTIECRWSQTPWWSLWRHYNGIFFSYILLGCFNSTAAYDCQKCKWSNPEEYGYIHHRNSRGTDTDAKTKHNKTVCIFCGMFGNPDA